MAARTTAYEAYRKDGQMQAFKMIANETIYKGTPILLKSSGRLAFSNDGTTNTIANGDVFAGISVETKTSGGSAGVDELRSYLEGNFRLPFTDTLTQGDVGKPVYVNNTADDAAVTITADAGANVQIGYISEFINASTAMVVINQCVFKVAATA